MARPRKAVVDYFPHDTSHGKTMFILESRWKNDGYAVWFKLLERLGSSDGHYLDCRFASERIYLSAQLGVEEKTFIEIMDTLAEVEAIDRNLWWQHKVIFCQKFIDRVEDVYSRRKQQKPSLCGVIAALNLVIDNINPINDADNPQTKLNEIKGNKTISPPLVEIPTETPRMTLFEIRSAFREHTGTEPNGSINNELSEFCKDYTREAIIDALMLTGTRVPKPTNPFSYFRTTLQGRSHNKESPGEAFDPTKDYPEGSFYAAMKEDLLKNEARQ